MANIRFLRLSKQAYCQGKVPYGAFSEIKWVFLFQGHMTKGLLILFFLISVHFSLRLGCDKNWCWQLTLLMSQISIRKSFPRCHLHSAAFLGAVFPSKSQSFSCLCKAVFLLFALAKTNRKEPSEIS